MNKVINFHDISDSEWFENLVLILKSKYSLISIEDIEGYYHKKQDLKNTCHLTFDDGDKSFYDIVYPILKRHNIPASIFVSPKMCGEQKNFWFQEIRGYNETKLKKIISEAFNVDNNKLENHSIYLILKCFTMDQIWFVIEKYQSIYKIRPKESCNLSVDQLIEIDKGGLVTVGAHTLNHPILANESDEVSKIEIIDSFYNLAQILGHEIKYFAYPNGWPEYDFLERELNTLKNCNCKIAFSCKPNNFTKKDNALSVNRYNLSYANLPFIRLKLSLGEHWEYLKKFIVKGEVSNREEIYKAIHSYRIFIK